MAFCPVAFAASRASLVAALFVIGAFVPVVAPRRWAAVAGGLAVASAIFAIEDSFLARPAGFAIAGLTFFWCMRRAGAAAGETLDAPVRALEPFALWVAMAGVFTAHGAQSAHLHSTLPTVARALVALAVLAAVSSVIGWRSLRRALARVYRGADRELSVRPTIEDVDAPLVTWVAPVDAAIMEGAASASDPYRASRGVVVARVPSDPSVLGGRLRMRARRACGTTILVAAAGALVVPPLDGVAHRPDLATVPTKLPPLPGQCHGKRVELRFVPVAPLRALDIEEIAGRYSQSGIADVAIEPSLEFDERWLDRNRRQLAGEEILRDARKKHVPRDGQMIIVVTDRDMFLRETDWRFAFATREAGIAVVSVARMDPDFPFHAPMTHAPARSGCAAPLRARAFRMITRQVLLGLCSAGTVDDPRSARRHSVMGMSDLDTIDEATY